MEATEHMLSHLTLGPVATLLEYRGRSGIVTRHNVGGRCAGLRGCDLRDLRRASHDRTNGRRVALTDVWNGLERRMVAHMIAAREIEGLHVRRRECQVAASEANGNLLSELQHLAAEATPAVLHRDDE